MYHPGCPPSCHKMFQQCPSWNMMWCHLVFLSYPPCISINQQSQTLSFQHPYNCAVQCRLSYKKVIKLCSIISKVIFQNHQEMSSVTTKCTYYNSGSCKFASRGNGCRDIHPTENCIFEDCKYKYCPHRHPKQCKYVEHCMFQSRCLYKHNEFQEISTSTEIDKCN